MCLCWGKTNKQTNYAHLMSCTQGGRVVTKSQTCHSASLPAWPPPAWWPAQVLKWRGCSGACCPCPSPPGADFAGMLCLGWGAAAPATGYIAEEAWWDSPADSEDAGKPPRTQVMATGEIRSTHRVISLLSLLHVYIKKVMFGQH